jgi:hypothetical protein
MVTNVAARACAERNLVISTCEASIVSKAILPVAILVIAAVVYGLGGSLGAHIGPGWDDILQGVAIFIGIIGMALGAGRFARAQSKSRG